MNRIILADNQAIFRAGAARTLALEDDMRIVAQCEDAARLFSAMESFRGCTVLFSSSLPLDVDAVVVRARAAGHRPVLIGENGYELPDSLARALDGILFRGVDGAALLDTVRRVGQGQRCIQTSNLRSISAQDVVGARVRDRLTPKEMQIVALIVQGCKNKVIASQLGTKEQVIKNYLRSIYDKTGVSDRLELALFTIHHRNLAEAAARAADLLHVRTA
ncbi:MAG: response regulator transcription factor [Acidobacteriota bacterium]|nr:response regulator transcription factor [Acidobacteriota bacterium]